MIHSFSQIIDDDQPDQPADSGALPGQLGSRTDLEAEYPLVQRHNMQAADIALAKRAAKEATYVGGSEVSIHLRTDNDDIDVVWDEDPDPTYWEPVIRKATFDPKTLEVALKQWGPDAPLALDIYFSLLDIQENFGTRSIRPGDVIFIPYNAIGNVVPRYFRVVNAAPTGNFRFDWLYLGCHLESLTGDITVQPSDDAGLMIRDYD